MIIYGSMTNTSIGNLFIAGFIPGVLLMILFMSYIIIRTKINPSLAGESMEENTLKEKFFMLLDLLPPLFIFLLVMGSIYLGYATPTESASMGVVGAFLLLILYKKFSFKVLHEAFMSTVKVSSMIIFIMLCAQFFNFIIGMLGLPKVLVEQISLMTTNKYILLITLIIFYMILGCFLETLSMMIATVPIIIPLILFYEIDPVWFGIFFVLIMQISLITPPVGMNLYVLQGLRETGKITDVIYGSLPFVLIMVLLIILLIIFPEIALWLPNKVGFQTQ
jgi:tripartite ATP-independent transporter DctM subunit